MGFNRDKIKSEKRPPNTRMFDPPFWVSRRKIIIIIIIVVFSLFSDIWYKRIPGAEFVSLGSGLFLDDFIGSIWILCIILNDRYWWAAGSHLTFTFFTPIINSLARFLSWQSSASLPWLDSHIFGGLVISAGVLFSADQKTMALCLHIPPPSHRHMLSGRRHAGTPYSADTPSPSAHLVIATPNV